MILFRFEVAHESAGVKTNIQWKGERQNCNVMDFVGNVGFNTMRHIWN